MTRHYNLSPGYITIPTAAKIVLRILDIKNNDNQSYYKKILSGAKKGWFGGKMHGKRMFQVRKKDIFKYAEELLSAETYNLFTFDGNINSTEIGNFKPFSTNDAKQQNSYII